MEKRTVYADNAATTRVSDSVLEAMLPVFTEDYGNPSSVHSKGRQAARLLLQARERTAAAIGCKPGEVYFTSGGTEADNWAVRSAAALGAEAGKRHVITTAIEHHAVLRPCEELEKQGFRVTYLTPDEYGCISPHQVEQALSEDVCLVSVMAANNEIGTIQPVADIAGLCRSRGILFHTDAVQAVGNILLNVEEMGIDMLSLSGHKLHAPKGVGALYIRRGIKLPPFMLGGSQQRGMRAGTDNVPSIVGLGQALCDLTTDMESRTARLSALRDRLAEGLLEMPRTRLNGHPTKRLCGNVNISAEGIEGESLLLMLETAGIFASSGAACASGSAEPSHVLTAIGLDERTARGSLRLSIGDDTTEEDIDYLIYNIKQAVGRIRERSPLWAEICGM